MLVILGALECGVFRGGTLADVEHSVSTSNACDSVLGRARGSQRR